MILSAEDGRILISHESGTYWEYPDGSHRCVTKEDAETINKLCAEHIAARLKDRPESEK